MAHIKDQVSTIKEAIATLEELDKVEYAEDLKTLRKELAVAVLHQVKKMKQRTELYKQSRALEDAADNFSNQVVTAATQKCLNVPVQPYLLIDERPAKRQRGVLEARSVVPDSLESPYMHTSLLDIDELMK